MIIVPSGNRRFIKLQQSNLSSTEKRDTVQQEDIPLDGQEYNPLGKLDNTLQNQKQKPSVPPKIPDQTALNNAVQMGGETSSQPPVLSEDNIYQSLESFFAEYLKQVGYEEKWIQYILNSKSIFDYDIDDMKNQVNVVMHINKQDLDSLDKDKGIMLFETMIKKKFPVNSLKITKGSKPGRFEVRFSFPRKAEQAQDFTGARGYSEEVAETAGKIGPQIQKQQTKAASSRNCIIKNAHNGIIDSLIKQGLGGNHAS